MVARGALSAGPSGVLAVLASLAAAAPRQDGDGRPPHEKIEVPSIAACGACHVEVAREWAASLHARAWTNANVRRATDDFAREACRPCHSPRPVFETGFDVAPAYRSANRTDGVHCLSCHGLPDGVAAARTIPGAPCRPCAEPRLLAVEHCRPCHQPTHGAFDEYAVSRAAAEGVRCVDCHMPLRPDGSGRSHGPHGGLDAEFVKRGLDWEARRDEEGVHLLLRNRTGHRFPGEIPSRSLHVVVQVAGGAPEVTVLRKPRRGEDRADDRLLPDEERELAFPAPPEAAVELRLVFVPLPLLAEEEGFLLGTYRSARLGD